MIRCLWDGWGFLAPAKGHNLTFNKQIDAYLCALPCRHQMDLSNVFFKIRGQLYVMPVVPPWTFQYSHLWLGLLKGNIDINCRCCALGHWTCSSYWSRVISRSYRRSTFLRAPYVSDKSVSTGSHYSAWSNFWMCVMASKAHFLFE